MRYGLLAFIPLLTSCIAHFESAGPPRHETQAVPLDKAELVKADLIMGAGELRLSGGAQQLLEAEFDYSSPSWKPRVHYMNSGVRGYLTVEQPSSNMIAGNNKYVWDLKMNDAVPLDLKMKFGAGQADVKAGSLSLRSVEVEMGVGQLILDLRGAPKRDYDVHVRGGVGEATIYLPQDVGVYADATGGIGGVDARGLKKQGGHYQNDAYDTAKVKIHLDVRGGIGAIHLLGE